MTNSHLLRSRFLPSILFAALLVAFASAPGCSQQAEEPPPDEPTAKSGLDAARFGMSLDEARVVFPDMRLVTGKLAATHFDAPQQDRYLIDQIQVPGLPEELGVELRFWEQKLWTIVVYTADIPHPDVLAHLEGRFGPRTEGTAERPMWNLPEITIQVDQSRGWYAVSENQLSETARQWFLDAVRQGGG